MLATLARQADGARGGRADRHRRSRHPCRWLTNTFSVLTSGRQFSDTIIYDPAAVEAEVRAAP